MDREERERQRILSILKESEYENCTSETEEEGDHLSVRSQDSDTDQEASDNNSDDEPLIQLRRHLHSSPSELQQDLDTNSTATSSFGSQERTTYFFGKDGTKWRKTPLRQNVRTRAENIITQAPGVRPVAQNAASENECWNIFFTDQMVDQILAYTNARIQIKIAACQDPSKYSYMKECNRSEFLAFLGLLYMAGKLRSGRQNLADLWASDSTGTDIFRLTMSQRRFHFIQSNLCFDDMTTRDSRKLLDNLAPIRDIFEAFIHNCRNSYMPEENLTIDEMLLAFRGRCKFRQYISSKPAKYGLKFLH